MSALSAMTPRQTTNSTSMVIASTYIYTVPMPKFSLHETHQIRISPWRLSILERYSNTHRTTSSTQVILFKPLCVASCINMMTLTVMTHRTTTPLLLHHLHIVPCLPDYITVSPLPRQFGKSYDQL